MPPPPPPWPQALALLDEALALDPGQREPWLARVQADQPDVAPLLNKLLTAHGRLQSCDALATLPKLYGDLRAAEVGAAGARVGPFELIEPLGRGGMGSVWRARHAEGRIKRDVAVKLPAGSGDPTRLAVLRERFARERDFLAQLEHPHIARLYDAGVSDDGQPYLAMEYVAGRTIAEHCDAQRLPVKARLELFLQVLDAVAYAHQQLVLHRDLKPGNVLVDPQGQVRLLDFGVARLLPREDVATAASELTERAGSAYTLGYAAPEQLTGGALSTATDVYALGVMLHHLLTGLSPYEPARDTRGGLEDAVLLSTPREASARTCTPEALAARQTSAAGLRKALRGDLDVVIGKALKKNPAERYPTVAALAQDLRLHLARQPITARADGWGYRARLFVRRHATAVAATSLASLALLGSTGAALWQARVSADNAARATREAARAGAAQKFFAALLSQADPERNRNITALDRKVVDEALARAEHDFADAPETLALVLKQLGDLYARLGIPDRKLDVMERRARLLAATAGAPVDDVVEAQLDVGAALIESASAAERARATPTLLAALQMARSRGAGDALMVQALCQVADQYVLESKFDEADRYAAMAVEHAEARLPNPHPHLSWAYEQRAVTNARLGRLDAARDGFRRAMAVDATGQGRGKLEQFKTRANLVNTEYVAGNYRAAQREGVSALAYSRENFGDTGGSLAPLRLRTVLASVQAGALDDAARLAGELLAQDLASDDFRRVGQAHYGRGVVALARGDLAEAARAFAAAGPGMDIDPRWRRRLAAQNAILQLKAGRPDAASALLEPVLADGRAAGATASDDYAAAAEVAGVALVRRGRVDEARALFDEVCAARGTFQAANHPNRLRCEAYRVLAAARPGREARQRALQQQLDLLIAGRDDRIALATSMRAAQGWAAQDEGRPSRWPGFPLLD